MYTPPAFAIDDLDALDRLVGADAFVTLVTVADGAPCASHLPVLYRRDGRRVRLSGHWARPNPQARHEGRALAIVHGPHAYVSPGVYPDKETAARVPTWNYAVAHLGGRLRTFEDEAGLGALVAALSHAQETRIGRDWTFEPDREDHRRQLRGIVGFHLDVDTIEVKFKLGQNHPVANIAAVAADLDARPEPRERAVAALMREHALPAVTAPMQGD
ncbi:FMN-binding negative transcriptional regulator [Marilutibacter aestuarii]|uniref:FMN-binding negative transcriptional regulator n=1 Tax=Marilutibacter aestuarii TaxID=1706195 RepID=A0A507ZXY4_9GAMM|nr:FMN-binding negative transcriptional regulator [Lysobacter aestuarii]TQD42566.1 FMN-binding negative transcriptional regulator [Lysobacter aestuarii]